MQAKPVQHSDFRYGNAGTVPGYFALDGLGAGLYLNLTIVWLKENRPPPTGIVKKPLFPTYPERHHA